MNRRRVLRRRIVVAVLLLLSVALLTAYFRESDSGVAHSVQGAVLTVVSPLQSGTATATKPFRDAWNWVGDLFSAKSQNKSLQDGGPAAARRARRRSSRPRARTSSCARWCSSRRTTCSPRT